MHGAGDRVLRGQAAQVGEGEQGLGADHDGKVPFELGQRGFARRAVAGQRAKRVVDEPEPVARPGVGRG